MSPTRSIVVGCLFLTCAVADDKSFDFDPNADFARFKSFVLNRGAVHSQNPEFAEELVRAKVNEALRTELARKGLAEKALTENPKPDLIVNYRVGSANRRKVETWIGPWGGAHRAVYTFTEGTLVVDLLRREGRTLVWRGIYRDDEKKPAKLSSNLSRNVRRLFEKYPPEKK